MSDGRQALDLLQRHPVDLLLLDILMPGMSGIEVLEEARRQDPDLTVVLMTAYGSIEMAVDAMRRGAWDFITKPFDLENLERVLRKGLERGALLRENRKLRRRVQENCADRELVGQSRPMQRLWNSIQTTARTDYPVLIRGESGTGKELVARSIHAQSRRAGKPLVMVNCPAIPEHLLESELFGYHRGAFTGADRDHEGLFVEADGGTICLDEIGDIAVAMQTKLLRVLQEQEIRPLGAGSARRVDVRVVASTNRDLEQQMRQRLFREDLYYRLNVVTLRTPSLGEIRDDIPLLVDHFVRQVCRELSQPVKRCVPETLSALMARPWPGNVRELQNVMRRAVMFCSSEEIQPEYLFAAGETAPRQAVSWTPETVAPYKEARERMLEDFTAQYIGQVLACTGGNVSQAARLSGLTRAAMQKIMRRRQISSAEFRV
ncbi:MAG: DNA-binding response regulator [Desulfobulbaceae bacterium A2]|nr:MAG: DNA-binding response regulator [Desulfobulbaceae bacterium A2]